jgi:hypothetical protein
MEMAELATQRLADSKVFLITDHPNDWVTFPGKVISYSRKDRSNYLTSLIRKNPELEQIAGGYWLYSLERLFALQKIYEYVRSDEVVLHYESDVLLLLNESDFDLMVQVCSKCACPRFSKERGIASLFFIPNHYELSSFLNSLKQILSRKNFPTNDMELLGLCLNENIVDELPSLPNDSWTKPTGEKIVFDGAAYGQYLFGQDPFHTGGRRISGFQNPDFAIELSQLNWKISDVLDSENKSLAYAYKQEQYRVLNLHLHSKIRVGAIDSGSALWAQAINEANGKTHRVPGELEENLIHTQKITIVNRLRIARRKGLSKSIAEYFMRRVKRASQLIWRNDD